MFSFFDAGEQRGEGVECCVHLRSSSALWVPWVGVLMRGGGEKVR